MRSRAGDIGWDDGSLSMERAIKGRRKKLPAGEPRRVVGPTKSRHRRVVAIDGRSLEILRGQVDDVARRATQWGEELVDDGQELGFTLTQVAMRAGHDPAVASRHYTAKVNETDQRIAEALSGLLDGGSL